MRETDRTYTPYNIYSWIKHETIFVILIVLLASLNTVYGESTENVLFEDDFIYTNIDQMKYAGWNIIGDENYIHFYNGSIILDNDCIKTAWVRYPLSIDLYNKERVMITSIAKWLNGNYGSFHVIFKANNHTFTWWRDGYYNRFKLDIDGKRIYTSDIIPIKKGVLYNISVEIVNNSILNLYFNDTLQHSVDIHEIVNSSIINITEIGLNSAWCSKNSYDMIIIKSILRDDFTLPKLKTNIPIITSSFNQDNIYLSIKNPILFIDTCNKPILQKFELLHNNTMVSFKSSCHESAYPVRNYEELLRSLGINNSIAIYSNDTETLLYAYLLATKLNLPLIKYPSQSQIKDFKPIYNITSKDQAIQLYISEIKKDDKEIENIVVVNANSNNAFLAARLAAFTNSFPIFINVEKPRYDKNITAANSENKVFDIRSEIIKTIDDLSDEGFFYKSKNFILQNKLPGIIILGNEVPYFEFPETIDKFSVTCYAGFCDDYILTDSPYCNFNKTLRNETEELLLQHGICSRIIGSPEEISFQTELFRKNRTIPKEMLIINDYSDLPVLSWLSFSNMALGYKTYVELAKQNVNVTRMVERRAPYEEINTSTIIKIVKELINETKDLDEDNQFSKILTALNFLKSVIKEVTYMYEYDWYNGLKRFKESGFSDFSIEPFPNINESKINDYKTIIYIANYSRNNWYLNNKSYNFSELNNSIYFIYNLHANSVNTTSNSLIRNGNIVVSSLSSNVVPGYNAFAAKILLKNTSYYIGYSSTYAKNYILGLDYFLKSEEKIFENPPMNPYYKLSASVELNTLPSLSFTEKPIIQKEDLPEIRYSDIIILNGSYQVNCRFFNYMNRTLILCSEDYLNVEGLPIIPIFYKKIELPINSEVKEIKLIPEFDHIENVYIPYNTNQSNFTKFPSRFIVSKRYKSFANKTIIEMIYSPIIYYKNNSADILKDIKYEIKYDTPFDVLSFKVFSGENITGLIKLYSNKKQMIEAKVIVENNEINRTIEDSFDVIDGLNYKKLNLGNLKNGKYNITLTLFNNNSIVSRKFTINIKKVKHKDIPISSNFIKSLYRTLRLERDFMIYKKIDCKDNETKIEISSWNYTLHIDNKPKSTIIELRTPTSRYMKISNAQNATEVVQTPFGTLTIEYVNGSLREHGYGNIKHLRDQMNKMRDMMNEIIILNDLEELW